MNIYKYSSRKASYLFKFLMGGTASVTSSKRHRAGWIFLLSAQTLSACVLPVWKMDLRDKRDAAHQVVLVISSRRNALKVICVWSNCFYVSSNVSHVHKVWDHCTWWRRVVKGDPYMHRNIQGWAVFVPNTLQQVLSGTKSASEAGPTQSCSKSFIVCVQTHSSTDLDSAFCLLFC